MPTGEQLISPGPGGEAHLPRSWGSSSSPWVLGGHLNEGSGAAGAGVHRCGEPQQREVRGGGRKGLAEAGVTREMPVAGLLVAQSGCHSAGLPRASVPSRFQSREPTAMELSGLQPRGPRLPPSGAGCSWPPLSVIPRVGDCSLHPESGTVPSILQAQSCKIVPLWRGRAGAGAGQGGAACWDPGPARACRL